jgi:hypothetical protein
MTARHPAVGVARAFVDAVIWGEHSTVWGLLSPAGRDRVLSAGSRGGLDSVMAERIRLGTSSQSEMDVFLSGLVHGLRFDLSAADLDQIAVATDVVPIDGALVRVLLEAPAPFHQEAWSVGSIDLCCLRGDWLVDRLEPRLIKK